MISTVSPLLRVATHSHPQHRRAFPAEPSLRRLAFGQTPAPVTAWQAIKHRLARIPEAKWLLWLGGLEYLPGAVMTPWVTQQQLRRSNIPERDRALLVRQEILRQLLGGALYFASYYGGLLLTGTVLEKLLKSPKPNSLWKFAGAVGASTLAYGLLRPVLLNTLTLRWLYGETVATINSGRGAAPVELPQAALPPTFSAIASPPALMPPSRAGGPQPATAFNRFYG